MSTLRTFSPEFLAQQENLYRPEYCERVQEWGRLGWTIIEMSTQLNVSKVTFYRWIKRYDEFAAAVAMAREYSEAFHAADLRQNAGQPSSLYNAAGKRGFMGLVYPAWREKQQVEVLHGSLADELARRRARHLGQSVDTDGQDDDAMDEAL